jgi:hypothetical protein
MSDSGMELGEGATLSAAEAEALRVEALRVHDRYLNEVVIAFGFCPWAERALREGGVRRRVLTTLGPAPEDVLPVIDELEAAGDGVEIGFAIFPRWDPGAAALDRFTEKVRQIDRARRHGGVLPPFVLAAFHPRPAAAAWKTPYQLVSFIRRTPDPTIQLVRAATLDDVRRAARSVSDDIAQQNFDRVTAEGYGRLDATLVDIRRDRDAAYANRPGGAAPAL